MLHVSSLIFRVLKSYQELVALYSTLTSTCHIGMVGRVVDHAVYCHCLRKRTLVSFCYKFKGLPDVCSLRPVVLLHILGLARGI